MRKTKLGRNARCSCGSGKKFKHCHGKPDASARGPEPRRLRPQVAAALSSQLQQQMVRERAWVARFGQVPIPVVAKMEDKWIVGSGNRIYASSAWVTFHDFLLDYIRDRLGTTWGNSELAKPAAERHPLLNWYQRVCEFQARHFAGSGKVSSARPEGVAGAYLRLAYDLFTVQHAMLLEERLLARLRRKRDFQGARYELQVAACFVRAGFDLELEDESDSRRSHCEFTARHRPTGASYSVEAKSRHRPGVIGEEGEPRDQNAISADITRLMQKALKKDADHSRVVFIDVNVPPSEGEGLDAARNWVADAVAEVDQLEAVQSLADPWPPAFMFFTNWPYHYLDDDEPERGNAVAFGTLNMRRFEGASPEHQRAFEAEHPAIYALFQSLLRHNAVPHDLEWMARVHGGLDDGDAPRNRPS